MPLITTVIPCFNHAEFLRRSVGSVVNQCGDFDVEVIIVNDGSSDDTVDIASKLMFEYASVRLVNKPNGGLSSARNAGIAVGLGDFYHFLDADDYILPGAYSELIRPLCMHEAVSITHCSAEVRDIEAGETYIGQSKPLPPDALEIFASHNILPVHSFVLKRGVVSAVGLFDEKLQACEDWDYWVRAAYLGFGFASVKKPLVVYERQPNSMSRSYPRMLKAADTVAGRASALLARRTGKGSTPQKRSLRAWIFNFSCVPSLRSRLRQGNVVRVLGELVQLLKQDWRLLPLAVRFILTHKRMILLAISNVGSRF